MEITQDANELRASLVKLATGQLEQGIIHEPRAFFDVIEVKPDGTPTPGHPEVFKNGEQFPIRLTHMTAAVALFGQDQEEPEVVDERFIGDIGLRMVFHNQMYMNPQFLPVPIWSNKAVAASDVITDSTASWRFDVPFVMSARDTLLVDVLSALATDEDQQLPTVTLTGIGLLSGRPYLISGQQTLVSPQRTRLGTTFFRNDGSEPMIISNITVTVSQPANELDPIGDIRSLSLNIRQTGNGTNAFWCQGPDSLPAGELMPATLWGVTTGRAVVHKFPGDGLIWEPGEGIDVVARALPLVPGGVPPEDFDAILDIALTGYITIT
jgi:hypothetical protein